MDASATHAVWPALPVAWLAAAAFIALGWIALNRICPTRERNACQASLLLCTLGMSIGLAIDARDGHLAMLDALCRSGAINPLYWIQLHWQQLPAMHAGMLIGSLLTPALTLGRSATTRHSVLRRLVCCALMLTGMAAGTAAHGMLGGGLLGNSALSLSTMIPLMIVGMTWGTLVGARLLNTAFAVGHSLHPTPLISLRRGAAR
jgi:hypothetical protein